MKHNVYIGKTKSHAYVDPGIVVVRPGDTVTFKNKTGAEVKLLFGEDDLLVGVKELQVKEIKANDPGKISTREFRVKQNTKDDIYEYVATVKINNRRIFAVGSSTPKIIVRPSSPGT